MQESRDRPRKVWMCRLCMNLNPANTPRCSNCWSQRSDDDDLIDLPDAKARGVQIGRHRRYRTAIVRVAVACLAVLVSAWYILPRVGVALFPTDPSSSISSVPVNQDWPMYQRDPSHSGALGELVRSPRGAVRWSFVADGPIYASPAVGDGVVYLATGAGTIFALSSETGALLWQRSTGGQLNSSPAVAGGMLFIGRFDGGVEARDLVSGEVLWEFMTGDRILSSPAVHEGVLYIASGDGSLYALDAESGSERWSYDTDGWITSSPAVSGEVVAIVSFDGRLHVVYRLSGKRRLDFYVSESPRGSAAVGERNLLVTDGRGRIKAVDWRMRTLPLEWLWQRIRTQMFYWGLTQSLPQQKGFVWGVTTGDAFNGTPVVTGGRVYAANFGGEVIALAEATGEVLWRHQAGVPIMGSMSAAGDVVFAGDLDGVLHALNADDGGLLWQFKTGGQITATPVVADGVIYLGSWDGTLYAIE